MTRIIFTFVFMLALPAAAEEQLRTITVAGEGVVTATPDMAELTIGVSREARRPDEALGGVADGVAAVFAVLDAAGIEPRDRRTSGLSLQPRWERHSGQSQPARIVGYTASNRVTVRVRDLAVLGGLIVDTVGEGANTLGGLRFVLADPAPLEAEARRLAVFEAKSKAALYAESAEVELGPLLTLNDGGVFRPQPGPVMAEMAMRSADAMPVAEGELEVRAAVSMVYLIGE
ncbi:MAG: SIMPL domain-containing protein [Paracoccaceae bacterium]|nr:SIMPL domain-containing protein [Paracoccaceae bacterium]